MNHQIHRIGFILRNATESMKHGSKVSITAISLSDMFDDFHDLLFGQFLAIWEINLCRFVIVKSNNLRE